jgi:hypothetical protein
MKKGATMSVQSTDFGIEEERSPDAWQLVGDYPTYGDAQRAAARLSREFFPVETAEIIGGEVRFVERVSGRTYARAAIAGAATGSWFGLFFGLLVELLTTGPVWLGVILIGALSGAGFGLLARWSMAGERDFVATRAIATTRYNLRVLDVEAERARHLLAKAR